MYYRRLVWRDTRVPRDSLVRRSELALPIFLSVHVSFLVSPSEDGERGKELLTSTSSRIRIGVVRTTYIAPCRTTLRLPILSPLQSQNSRQPQQPRTNHPQPSETATLLLRSPRLSNTSWTSSRSKPACVLVSSRTCS